MGGGMLVVASIHHTDVQSTPWWGVTFLRARNICCHLVRRDTRPASGMLSAAISLCRFGMLRLASSLHCTLSSTLYGAPMHAR